MLDQQRERLRAIKTFPSLVKYLRDELDWPIETEDFDDIVFEYGAEELGIDPATAVKISAIKQLRPLVTNQPWGIFFVKFEPKKLPVVVLRRILSRLALKKRASANRPDHASWDLDDLLFISSYGEDEQRQMTFAHFSQDKATGDLPALKVLGWDDADTALHLDFCHQELKGKLRWPDDVEDLEDWHAKWSSAFVLYHREVITTSRQLATRLADLARRIRRRANAVLTLETEGGQLRKLYRSFQEALIHDLSEDGFADMYAQTIAYGLLAARVSRPMSITADSVGEMIPITNPFLRDMLGAFLTAGGRKGAIDFDELGVQEVVELLNSPDTRMDAILRDFGNLTQQEDPVIHFYELFLSKYDKKKRAQRGVFFTPRPVVSYIVRSVHELLQSDFGLEDGLADTTTWGEMAERMPGTRTPEGLSPDEPFVQILDPATGTATFLVEVIDIVHQTMRAKWIRQGHMAGDTQGLWNEYVAKHFVPRSYGFELMMAPYAIAHMKLGLKLLETAYDFGTDERIRVHLTNSLEPATDAIPERVFEQWAPALANEAVAVNAVKGCQRFTVVIGNPPYSGHSANSGEWARKLVEAYKTVDGKPLGEKNPKWLQDDYVKFIAFGQWRIEHTGSGVLAFITNHAYLDNPTFRGMRQSLMNTFDEIYILNLHGNVKKREVAPDGSKDENVFDIQQGVAIGILVKGEGARRDCRVRHADLWGQREGKYGTLADSDVGVTEWAEVSPSTPLYLFVPLQEELLSEYQDGWKVNDIFPVNSVGIVTARDDLTIHWSEEEVKDTIHDFVSLPSEEAREKYQLGDDVRDWKVTLAQRDLTDSGLDSRNICPVLYRPFDLRHTYYTGRSRGFHCMPRGKVMRNMMAGDNPALLCKRQSKRQPFSYVFVSGQIAESCVFESAYANNSVLPLYLYHVEGEMEFEVGRRHPNLNPEFVQAVAEKLGLTFVDDGRGDLEQTFGPEDVFNYCYAVFHSPTYRTRYAEFLKMDFPRLSLTSDQELFRALTAKGAQLVSLHLMKSPALDTFITSYPIAGSNTVEKVTYDCSTQRVGINKTQYFEGVPPEVWAFQIGGYQVCHKWLKDRKGRTLTYDELTHYQKVIVALKETIRLMVEIDKIIPSWPME